MKNHSLFLSTVALFLVVGCGSSDDPPGTGSNENGGHANGGGGGTIDGGGGGTDAGNGGGGTAGEGGTPGGAGGSGATEAGPDDADADEGTGGDAPTKPDANFDYDAPDYQSETCLDEEAKAEVVPLDIYFMLDRSSSMEPACIATPPFDTLAATSSWCRAINSMAGYVSNPAAEGNRAALQYFPVPTGSSDCPMGGGYSTPSVPLGSLATDLLTGDFSGHAVAFVNSLNSVSPNGGTPTEGALRGLAAYTKANKTAGRIIIGVLVTDGEPGTCSQDDGVLAGIAADHYIKEGIHTFFVGMDPTAGPLAGVNWTRLETWAKYTGAIKHENTDMKTCGTCAAASPTCTCHHYNVGNGNPEVFIAALNRIQKSAVSCTFQVPTIGTSVIDVDHAKVDYYPGGKDPKTVIDGVASESACGTGQGWYFDNPANPKTINLCPESCKLVQADDYALVNVRIPCAGT